MASVYRIARQSMAGQRTQNSLGSLSLTPPASGQRFTAALSAKNPPESTSIDHCQLPTTDFQK